MVGEIYQIICESLLISEQDFQHNFEEWKNDTIQSLFVLGYLGSGKTTTAKQLAQKYNATWIQLDEYREDEMFKLIKKRGLNINILDPKEEEKIYDEVFLNLENRIKSKKERLILEGVDVLFMNRQLVLNNAVIVKGTSLLTSTWRAWRRNINTRSNTGYRNKSIYYIIKNTAKHQHRFYKLVNQFIKDLKRWKSK